ncbi:MAG: site-specific integrase, partial [Peptococcaceae bacterium]|nr:site-specific integrase [Peptococcaceae bacterium]
MTGPFVSTQVIRASLKFAVAQKKIAVNPALNVVCPTFTEEDRDLPSEEEIKAIFAAMRGTRFYLPAVVSSLTTLRRGELFALCWSEIDFKEEGAKIRRTLSPSKKGLLWDTPKTKGSRRIVAMPSSLMPLLAEHKTQQEIQKAALGEFYNDNDLVFCREDGRPINPSTFSKAFGDFRKRMKLPHMRLHDFRHLSVDTLYETENDPKTIMMQAGHTTIGTSLRY